MAGVLNLFAGSLKGFTHRRSCLRFKRALFYGGIDWHRRPRKSRKFDTRKGLIKYDSGYALILQPLLASASPPCKSVCRLAAQPAAPHLPTLRVVGVDQHGTTAALMLAHGFTDRMLVRLVRAGLITIRHEGDQD